MQVLQITGMLLVIVVLMLMMQDCSPYVPLQMVRAVSETTFQPRIAFKTRYGMAVNPMSESSAAVSSASIPFTADSNTYYRRARVSNLM